MKKYTLHFRNSGIPFCFAEIMFKDKNSYGAFDYIVFYKGVLLEGYLSDKGIKDAKKFGLQLMKNHDMVYNKMLAFKKKAKNFEYTSWNDMKKFIEELGIIYLYCEQPVLAGIEEIFEKYCKNPIECLKDPSTCTFISEKGKISHDIISKFGRMKYDLHVIL